MDVEKCITLHNRILQHAYLHSGHSLSDYHHECKPWFDFYGAAAESIRDTISSDLVAFLEGAHVTTSNKFSYFYYVSSLYDPEGLYEEAQCLNEADYDESENRFVALYAMGVFSSSHRCGVVYDQIENKAIMCETIWDADTICNGRTEWYPLETILEAWLDMIEQGKIIASSQDQERFPWKLVPYSESCLQRTINAYNSLVEEIEARLPSTSSVVQGAGEPLLEDTILDIANPKRGFAYLFARKVKRPRFRFIAPGLEIPPRSNTMKQPFASLRYDSEDIEILPTLLFRATNGTMPCMAPTAEKDCPFGYQFNKLGYPAGLYLSHTGNDENAWEDECTLVLPYGIGAKGFIRRSDGARFGENTEDPAEVEASDTFADLYQPGHCPFTIDHSRQLVDMLENWAGMVRRGDWRVDENGVAGGIEEWKKADSEEEWEKYVIPITW